MMVPDELQAVVRLTDSQVKQIIAEYFSKKFKIKPDDINAILEYDYDTARFAGVEFKMPIEKLV